MRDQLGQELEELTASLFEVCLSLRCDIIKGDWASFVM